MMMRRAGLPFALAFAVAAPVAAQDAPDFSGQWVLVAAERPDPGVPSSLTVRRLVTGSNASGAPIRPSILQLVVERGFGDRTTTDTYLVGADGVRGGIEGGIIGGGGYQSRFSVGWVDGRLVITNASYSGPTREASLLNEHQETWELDPAGMLIITSTDRDDGHEAKSNRATYRRLK
jgi:hypothetical protein